MSGDATYFVELPEAMARDAITAGIGRREIPRRGLGDQVVIALGVGGSLISLVQAPHTFATLAAWVRTWSGRAEEPLLLKVGRSRDGRVVAEIAPEMDTEAVLALLRGVLGDEPPADG